MSNFYGQFLYSNFLKWLIFLYNHFYTTLHFKIWSNILSLIIWFGIDKNDAGNF